jgi:hypothetical protein
MIRGLRAWAKTNVANLLRGNLEQVEHTLNEIDEKARRLTLQTVRAGAQ